MRWRALAALAVALALSPRAMLAQQTESPHGPLSESCITCHAASGWKPARVSSKFRHADKTFPLDGAHARTACMSCHTSLTFRKTPLTCASCHSDVHHGELGTQCGRCHTARSFADVANLRRLHETTRFPLRGAHAVAQCEGCHAPTQAGRMQFTNRPLTCIGCHADSYRQAKTPDHVGSRFSQDCTSCHGVSTWVGAKFDHSTSKFLLDGAHRAVSCRGCHGDNVYAGKSTACVSCHQRTFDATLLPPHSALGFSAVCSTCHTTTTWKPATFDHATTRFPLVGAHRAVSCADCHADKVYRGKSMACVSCHQARYAATQNPPHAAAGFPTMCESCHNVTMWTGTSFNHAATRFPLTGAHIRALCSGCHADGVYRGKPTACVSCHQQNFVNALLPPHSALGFSATCSTCHTTAMWQPATFDHASTRFPLTGAHRAASCADCHADKVYRGKSMLCASCHQAAYTATKNPPHAAAGFPTTCESCHNTSTWTGAVFNHATTRFPLTGAHVSQPCSACHGDGVYRGKPLVCAGCHLAKYNATTNPSHRAAQFPTSCESCHTTATWLGATFNHDASFFPIYSGAHREKWSVCADCHTVPTNFAVFTCTSCHTKPVTDAQHQGRTGYVYASPSCYACHPRGRK